MTGNIFVWTACKLNPAWTPERLCYVATRGSQQRSSYGEYSQLLHEPPLICLLATNTGGLSSGRRDDKWKIATIIRTQYNGNSESSWKIKTWVYFGWYKKFRNVCVYECVYIYIWFPRHSWKICIIKIMHGLKKSWTLHKFVFLCHSPWTSCISLYYSPYKACPQKNKGGLRKMTDMWKRTFEGDWGSCVAGLGSGSPQSVQILSELLW